MNIRNENMKRRILITEDDIENQKYLQLILKRNFDVDFCDSENSFFDKVTKNEYEAIIMDVSLRGGKSGIEITREFKKNDQYKNIPVLCLSAHVFKQDQENARDAGVDVYLTKPVDNSVLINTLLNLTGEESTV
jgi:CheY-like chemotaxis protein